MKFAVLVLSLAAAVSARPNPDVSSIVPSGSYLPGTGSSGVIGGGSSILGTGSGIFGGSSGLIDGGGIGIGGLSGITGPGIGGIGGNLVQDQKHVYFYAAPDDEPVSRIRINIAPSAHKNTKIIFVKAPSAGPVIPEVIAPPSQAEDKTLVYVLVKKQDQGGQISIPASLGVKQGKPEVYFIKYRTQQDAEQQISGTLSGQNAGANVPSLNDEGSFIRSLSYGTGGGGILGTGISGGDLSGSSLLGTAVNGGRYGPPGASGPY